MRMLFALVVAFAPSLALAQNTTESALVLKDTKVAPVLNFKMKSLDGKDVELSQYQGKVILFVNVASKCGLTSQYKQLQALYENYQKEGFVVIGVPANQFLNQEPGTDKEIATFCSTKYNVTFPMLSKVVVKGKGIAPLYEHLTAKQTNPKHSGEITWNFEKFLISRDGEIVARFKPSIKPDDKKVIEVIEAELKKKAK